MSSPTTPASIGPGEFFPVVGVGPHEKPWPEGDQYDPELLLNGDRRNVLDHYRYWTVEAIVADLNTKRHKLQIAIENWQHDLNIGSVVRTANAFILRPISGWGWVLFSGILTLLTGVLILSSPDSPFWVLGMFLAIDILFQGINYLTLASAIKQLPHSSTTA